MSSIYMFLNSKNQIIYIGQTTDFHRRMIDEHFSYAHIENESERIAYEAILINQKMPKYNTQFKDRGKFEINIPDFEWITCEELFVESLKEKVNRIAKIDDIRAIFYFK